MQNFDIKAYKTLCASIVKSSQTLRMQVQEALIQATSVAVDPNSKGNVQPFDLLNDAISQNKVIRKGSVKLWIEMFAPVRFEGKTAKLDRVKLEGIRSEHSNLAEYMEKCSAVIWDDLGKEETLDANINIEQMFVAFLKKVGKEIDKARENAAKGGNVVIEGEDYLDTLRDLQRERNLASVEGGI